MTPLGLLIYHARYRDLNHSDTVVFTMMVTQCNPSAGEFVRSVAQIAEWGNLSHTSVRKSLKYLIQIGSISRKIPVTPTEIGCYQVKNIGT